jgi:hypothetical protein
MGGITGTDARMVQGVPLVPSTENKEDGIQSSSISDAGPVASERVRLARREHWLNALPQFGGHPPRSPDFLSVITHGSGSRS